MAGAFDKILAELGGGLAKCGERMLWVEGTVWGVNPPRCRGDWMRG
jgi:hypothetical protein